MSDEAKLKALEKKADKALNDMVKAQQAATKALRKTTGKPPASVQKLINKGFKLEGLSAKASKEVSKFKIKMTRKNKKVVNKTRKK